MNIGDPLAVSRKAPMPDLSTFSHKANGGRNVRHNPFPVTAGFETIYAHGVEVAPGSRLLFVSGQIGIAPDGAVREGFGPQFEQAIANLAAVLAGAGMSDRDLVKLTFFVTRVGDLPRLADIRRRLLPAGTAVTTLVVAALARPNLLVEVEAFAASTASSKA